VLVQVVSTLSTPPPPLRNTCGRIAIHPSGNFILVSNRGDDSLATFSIDRRDKNVALRQLHVTKTRGKTPRHFQFAGRFVVVANQDSDSLTTFSFDEKNGGLAHTGSSYSLPSPNFVCTRPPLRGAPITECPSSEF